MSLVQGKTKSEIALHIDEKTYLILVLRYKELSSGEGGGGGTGDLPFDIAGHLSEINTGVIDADYMNSRFEKYLKTLKQSGANSEQIKNTVNELHKSFATLTQEEQKYANIFLNDVQRGEARLEEGKPFRDYVNAYQVMAKNAQITDISDLLGLDKNKLTLLMNTDITPTNINEFGRFDDLKNSVDNSKAKDYFEALKGTLSTFKVNVAVDKLLQDFIVKGGFDV